MKCSASLHCNMSQILRKVMIQLTIHSQKNGLMYKTEDAHAATLGELLTIDIIYMPDFLRGILISPTDEDIAMDACHIETKDELLIISHREHKLPQIAMTKQCALQLVQDWELYLAQRRSQPLKTFYFKSEELRATSQDATLKQKFILKFKEISSHK
jgi:hypothetical protein